MLSAGRHLMPGAYVRCDLRRVVVNEMADAVMRDAPELGPVAQRGDGRFLVFGEDPAAAQADYVRELIVWGGRELCFHTHARRSRTAGRACCGQAATGNSGAAGVGAAVTPGVAGELACLGRMPKNCSASSVGFKSR